MTAERIKISHDVEAVTRPDGVSWVQPLITVVESALGAKVYATRDDGAVLMVRIWRAVLGRHNWEVPGGSADPADADVLATAARELTEETGYRPRGRGRLLATVHGDVGLMRKSSAVVRFDLTGLEAGDRDDEADEVRWFSREEIANLIADGEVVCALTLSALALGFLDHGGQ